jgi:hypothetical protein
VFGPIYMLLDPLVDFHVVTPFGRFTCCYSLWPIYMLLHPLVDLHVVTRFWLIYMLLHPFLPISMLLHPFCQFACFTPVPDSFSLHVVTPFYEKLANLHTATPSATIRKKYLLIHLLIFFLLASFYTASPP